VLLKVETALPTGSFKVRGAIEALSRLDPGQHVVTASAGNHALGIAYAAAALGLRATVVCAVNASEAKLVALRDLPVELVLHGGSFDDAERHALGLAQGDVRYVSAYNDPDVIAGAGTIGLELLAELSGPLTIVCPAGGGGLVSGVALAVSERPAVSVVAVEAEASRGLSTAVTLGRVTAVEVGATVADGLAGNLEPGSVTVDLARRHVDSFLAVDEEEIARAVRYLSREHGLVVEGAGAVAVAAVMAGKLRPHGRTVCLVTGRNIAPELHARLLADI
jgi:threonine dehydratase